jgi:FtsP/CotA-like multicopper oxidase with cupredoxin domain
VHPRRYRLRWLNTGPSRFYEIFITDPASPANPPAFWRIASDGNLLPQPLRVQSVRLGVAERTDVIIDFSQFAGRSIYLENRLLQFDGRGPQNGILPAGEGNQLLRIDVVLPPVADRSLDPSLIPAFYPLPPAFALARPQVTRQFLFGRTNGQWSLNGRFMDCSSVRFSVTQNSAERWVLTGVLGWHHPMHVHLEEHRILARNGQPPPPDEGGRKDVTRLQNAEQIDLFMRFRDWTGRYIMHCHNLVHEDHAMMVRFDVDPRGDVNGTP